MAANRPLHTQIVAVLLSLLPGARRRRVPRGLLDKRRPLPTHSDKRTCTSKIGPLNPTVHTGSAGGSVFHPRSLLPTCDSRGDSRMRPKMERVLTIALFLAACPRRAAAASAATTGHPVVSMDVLSQQANFTGALTESRKSLKTLHKFSSPDTPNPPAGKTVTVCAVAYPPFVMAAPTATDPVRGRTISTFPHSGVLRGIADGL